MKITGEIGARGFLLHDSFEIGRPLCVEMNVYFDMNQNLLGRNRVNFCNHLNFNNSYLYSCLISFKLMRDHLKPIHP